MAKSLESHKLFPYGARTLLSAFAAFTGNLALEIQKEIDGIRTATDRIKPTLMLAGTTQAAA